VRLGRDDRGGGTFFFKKKKKTKKNSAGNCSVWVASTLIRGLLF
jgi:hypothetical protein